MASSSHLVKDSSLEEEPGAKTLNPHNQAHCTYTMGSVCLEHLLFSYITESFIRPSGFKLSIAEY